MIDINLLKYVSEWNLSVSISKSCYSLLFLSFYTSFRQWYESNMLDTIVAFIVMQKLELMLDVEQFSSRLNTIDRTVGPVQNMQIRPTSGPAWQKQ